MNNIQRVVVFGGTSDIALATVRDWLRRRPGLQVVLAARPGAAREAAVTSLRAAGADVVGVDYDAQTDDGGRAAAERALAGGTDIDVVLVAIGVLGDQELAWRDVDAALRLVDVNCRAAVVCGVLAGQTLKAQGHGSLVLLSSVAGERIRRSNFGYGASKAGADGFYLGLGEALEEFGVTVVVVRPGFVKSAMTVGLPVPPLATEPAAVARDVVRAVDSGSRLVWSPAPMRLVMSALRHLPQPVFRRLPI